MVNLKHNKVNWETLTLFKNEAQIIKLKLIYRRDQLTARNSILQPVLNYPYSEKVAQITEHSS